MCKPDFCPYVGRRRWYSLSPGELPYLKLLLCINSLFDAPSCKGSRGAQGVTWAGCRAVLWACTLDLCPGVRSMPALLSPEGRAWLLWVWEMGQGLGPGPEGGGGQGGIEQGPGFGGCDGRVRSQLGKQGWENCQGLRSFSPFESKPERQRTVYWGK